MRLEKTFVSAFVFASVLCVAPSSWAAAKASAAAPRPATAAEQAKPLPVWRVWNARTREDKTDVYLKFLVKVYRVKLEAWKAAGLLTDYKVLTTEPRTSGDPDVIFMFKYADMAALDVPEATWDRIGDKATEVFKDDAEVQQWMKDFPAWRTFTGWSPVSRELIAQ